MRSATAASLLALALACGGSEQAAEPPPLAEKVAVAEPKPVAADPGAEGARLYALYCASCHGPGGAGDGPVAASLEPKPADHTDGATMNALSDEYLVRVISEGGAAVRKSPLMAPWGGTLDEARIRALVAFIRTLARPPYPSG